LAQYANAQEKVHILQPVMVLSDLYKQIGTARLAQDAHIRSGFLQPWQATLNTNLNLAIKARQAVRASRLELDAAKQTYVILYSRYSAVLLIACGH